VSQYFPLVLASSSSIRQKILRSAGLKFTICVPAVDETAIKTENRHLSPSALVEVLATAKALRPNLPNDALVLAGDQVLELDEVALDKVKTMEEARDRLWSLRGREHFLTGSTVLAQAGKVLWAHNHRSKLQMLKFSEQTLDELLRQTGKKILASVGCYELEAEGIRLFETIDHDYTAMLGLPILPVLAALREFGGLKR